MTTDISSFTGLAQKFDEGVDVTIKHPVTNEDTDIVIRVAAYRSERVKKVSRSLMNAALIANKKNPKKVTNVEEIEQNSTRMAAASVLSWNITVEGEPMPCTPESAFKLLSNPDYYFITEQLDKVADDDALFMKPLLQG